MHRTWAIIERELRRFRRSPMLIVMSLVMPIIPWRHVRQLRGKLAA